MAPSGILVPARFLTMTAHVVVLLTVAMARDPHVRAALPLEFSEEEYESADAELLRVLGSALGLMAVELGGFFSGVSMFHPGQGLLSALSHAAAALTLGLALCEQWDLSAFILTLTLCSVPPAVTEVLLVVLTLGRKRRLP